LRDDVIGWGDICRSYGCAGVPGSNDSRPSVHMRNGSNPWVHGHAADPFLALLIAIMIGAVLAGALLLLR
jgi:hypothetical protein